MVALSFSFNLLHRRFDRTSYVLLRALPRSATVSDGCIRTRMQHIDTIRPRISAGMASKIL
ncbi:MAG: hypothetical protein ACI9HH_000419, partial [Pseudomonadota bacterium]